MAETSDTTTITIVSGSPPPPPSPQSTAVASPCAACKTLRRRCAEKCILAPYFPPTEPIKFTIAHRVFGASNIIKFLQELPEEHRADAVSSMVYEANARIRDPVYGCTGAICQLQNQANELQSQLAKARAELITMHCQQSNLLAIICKEMTYKSPQSQSSDRAEYMEVDPPSNDACFIDDNNSLVSSWEALWT